MKKIPCYIHTDEKDWRRQGIYVTIEFRNKSVITKLKKSQICYFGRLTDIGTYKVGFTVYFRKRKRITVEQLKNKILNDTDSIFFGISREQQRAVIGDINIKRYFLDIDEDEIKRVISKKDISALELLVSQSKYITSKEEDLLLLVRTCREELCVVASNP